MTPLEKAIKTCGSGAELARRLGIEPQAVYQWKTIPISRAIEVESATGGMVSTLEILAYAKKIKEESPQT